MVGIKRTAGPGVIEWNYDTEYIIVSIPQLVAPEFWHAALSAAGRVTVAGAMSIYLFGYSSNSNIAIAASEAQLALWVVRGG